MGRRIRKITVVGVGTPPPLPLRPLVDEVLRALDAKRRAQALSDDGPETGAPGGERRTAGQGERTGR
jgi:hypothetical protein